MTGIHRTLKKWIPKEARSPADRWIGKKNLEIHEDVENYMKPQLPAEGPVLPMVDEEELRRSRRRTNSARRTGRSSTMLSGGDDDRLGG